jgi:hypothetical protein
MGHQSVVRALGASLVVGAALLGTTGSALASGLRARWLPSADVRTAGYYLYLRAARTPYGDPIDVGLPTAAADGTLAAVVDGLSPGRTYHLAMAAYTADGAESALSGELTLGSVNPCIVDRCDSATACDIHAVADGTWCAHEGERDPCAAVGSCRAGVCGSSPTGAGKLAATRVRVAVRRRQGRLAVHGAFPAPVGFDPTTTGATIDLADPDGAVLYHAAVSGAEFDACRQNSAFRYLASRRDAREHNGLRLFDLFRSARSVVATARAESVDLRDLIGRSALHVTLRFGETCARDLDLACRATTAGGLSCR